MNTQEPIQEEENLTLYYGLRFSFWYLVTFWALLFILDYNPELLYETALKTILTLLWFISGVSTLVFSILSIIFVKKKSFSITALVISSIFCLMSFIGFVSGFLSELMYYA